MKLIKQFKIAKDGVLYPVTIIEEDGIVTATGDNATICTEALILEYPEAHTIKRSREKQVYEISMYKDEAAASESA